MSGQRACTVPHPAARHPPPQGRRATPGTSHYPGYPRFPPGSCQAYPGSGRVVLFLPRVGVFRVPRVLRGFSGFAFCAKHSQKNSIVSGYSG